MCVCVSECVGVGVCGCVWVCVGVGVSECVCVDVCVCVCAYVYVCGCVKTYAHVHQLLWCAAVLVLTCTPTTEVTERTLAETREQADKSLREKNDMIAQLTQRI